MKFVCKEGHRMTPEGLSAFLVANKPTFLEVPTAGKLRKEIGYQPCCEENYLSLLTEALTTHTANGYTDDAGFAKFYYHMLCWIGDDPDIFYMMTLLHKESMGIMAWACELFKWKTAEKRNSTDTDDLALDFKTFLVTKMESQEQMSNVAKQKTKGRDKILIGSTSTCQPSSHRWTNASIKMEQVMDIRKMKDCFGTAVVCTNCESKGIKQSETENMDRQESSEIKRCSACHLVAYCSEKCQREHWFNNHQKMCKILTKKKLVDSPIHTTCRGYCEDCNTCKLLRGSESKGLKSKGYFLAQRNLEVEATAKWLDSVNTNCPVENVQNIITHEFWFRFGYHKDANCRCTKEMKDKRKVTMDYPMQVPFIMGEMSGKYIGWIDEHLAILGIYINALIEKCVLNPEAPKLGIETHLYEINKFIISMRAQYWYYVANEKKRCMSELLFTHKGHLNESVPLLKVDEIFKKASKNNTWWETFLNELAHFYRRLRSTNLVMFDTVNIPKKRENDFSKFFKIYQDAMLSRDRPIQYRPPVSAFGDNGICTHEMLREKIITLFVELPKDVKCSCCSKSLSDERAVWPLQPVKTFLPLLRDLKILCVDQSPSLEEIIQVRFKDCPIVFDDKKEIISCGRHECTVMVCKQQLAFYREECKVMIEWMYLTDQCYGCFKFCYQTHRCSQCRSVRYCSQECVRDDWKAHQENCKSVVGEEVEKMNAKTESARKLVGEKKIVFQKQCVEWMVQSNPSFFVDKFYPRRELELCLNGDSESITKIKPPHPSSDTSDSNLGNGSLDELEAKASGINLNKSKKKNPNKGKNRHQLNAKATRDIEENFFKSLTEEEKYVEETELRPLSEVVNEVETQKSKGNSLEDTLRETVEEAASNGKTGLRETFLKKMESIANIGDLNVKLLEFDRNTGSLTLNQVISRGEKDKSFEANKTKVKGKGEVRVAEKSPQETKILKFTKGHPVLYTSITVEANSYQDIGSIILKNFRKKIEGKHFEICHIIKQEWMNNLTCRIEDVSIQKTQFDSRVVCSIRGQDQDKKYSLKLTNMIDIGAHVDDLEGLLCPRGTTYKKTDKILDFGKVTKVMNKIMEPGGIWNVNQRPDQVFRAARLRLFLNGNTETLKCMEFQEFDDYEDNSEAHFSHCIGSLRPGCIGDTTVDFTRFSQFMCDCPEEEVLERRFFEFVVSGMCCACQVYYVESQREEEVGGESVPIGETFVEFRDTNLKNDDEDPEDYTVIRTSLPRLHEGELVKKETEAANKPFKCLNANCKNRKC